MIIWHMMIWPCDAYLDEFIINYENDHRNGWHYHDSDVRWQQLIDDIHVRLEAIQECI